MSGDLVYWPGSCGGDAGSVAVVTVSYNTRDLIALLIWSIHRLLGDQVQLVLVVDNGSTDGSRPLLEGCREAGLCSLIPNDTNRYHGPALNQAMSYLAARERDASLEPIGWVWLLDSDCVVMRPDVLTDVIDMVSTQDAALVGERSWDPWHRCERLGLQSLFLDPAQVWQPPRRFVDGGDPSYDLERSCVIAGLSVHPFPFVSQGYVIHRGRGTLASVHARRENTNRLYEWARTHHESHFELMPTAAATYAVIVDQFKEAVPILDIEHLVPACEQDA